VRLRLVAIGQRPPAWVTAGWREYARRFPPHLPLELLEIPAGHRARGADLDRARDREGKALLAATARTGHVVALDGAGTPWSTADLAAGLATWMQQGLDVDFLVGGPDGLSRASIAGAGAVWSLGPLTLPHLLVRVVVAEQLYRAWSMVQNHPYHRA